MSYQNRIVRSGTEAPEQLLANPYNWRIHPEQQQRLLAGILEDVGVLQEVIVNERTGNLVDGHLRVMLAIRHGQPEIPVSYVDLSPDEEKAALLTLDTLTGMAKANAHLFAQLLDGVTTGHPDLMAYLDKMAQDLEIVPSDRDITGAQEITEQDVDDLACECPGCGFRFNPK